MHIIDAYYINNYKCILLPMNTKLKIIKTT